MNNKHSLDVLLIDDEPERSTALMNALDRLGHRVVCHLPDATNLSREVSRTSPDIVIIDMDSPDRDMLESMASVSQKDPRPIVYFAETESDSNTISAAIHAGVSAYIVADRLQTQSVKPIIETAIAQFNAYQSLRTELEKTRTQLADRKVVEKAKGMLMNHQGCNEEQAYRTLRKLAMDRSQKIAEVAKDVIQILELTTPMTAPDRTRGDA